MDTVVKIDYSNYSIEELVNLQSEIRDLIDHKRMEMYDTAVNNVLNELEKMAKEYPYEEAFDYNETFTWKELYDMIRAFRY